MFLVVIPATIPAQAEAGKQYLLAIKGLHFPPQVNMIDGIQRGIKPLKTICVNLCNL